MKLLSGLKLLKAISYSIAALLLMLDPTLAQETSLKPGTLVERETKRGETHSYHIVVNAGQYLRVVAKQKDVDIKLALYGPKGEKLIDVDAANYVIDGIFKFTPDPGFASASEAEVLSFHSRLSATYRLDVVTVRPAAAAGRYELKIQDLRVATAQDRERIAAQYAFAEGERLGRQRSPESLRKALEKYKEALNLWRAPSERIEQSNTLDKLAFTNFDLDQKQKAVEWFEQSLRLWREASVRRAEAHALGNIFAVYHLQRDVKALDFINQALKLWEREGDKVLEVLTHLKCSFANKQLGEQQKGAFHFDEALRLARAAGDRRIEAWSLIHLGWGHDQSEGRRKELDYLGKALEICRNADHPICEATVLLALGDIIESLGQHTKALDHYDQVLRIARRWQDSGLEVFALIHAGEVHFYLSDYQKAIDHYSRALGPSRTSSNHWGEAYAQYNLGRVHEVLGEHEKALEYFEHSLPHWRIIGDYDGVAYTINQVAMILDARGEKGRVLEMLDEALQLMRYVKDPFGEARTLDNIGMVYASRRNHQKALNYFAQALPLRRAEHDTSGEARTLGNIGLVFNDLRENAKALDYLSQAIQRYQSIGNRSGEADMRYRMGRVRRNQGNETEARVEIEKAIEIAESLRAGVFSSNLRDSYFASIQTYYEFYIGLLMDLHKRHPSQSLNRVALNTVERARARGMLELLTESRADIRQGVDQTLLERERLLRQQLKDREQSRMRLLSGTPDPRLVEAAEKEISTVLSQYEQIEVEIKAKSPRYAALTQPRPLRVEEIQEQVLDSETLLLEYALGEERSFLWVVDKTSIHSYELPKRSDIDTASRKLYELLTAPQALRDESSSQHLRRVREANAQYEQHAAALSQALLGPVAPLLGTKRLLIVADGSVAYVPFAALPSPARNKSGTLLIADHEIVYLPSASTLAVLRQETAGRSSAPKAVAVFADPVFDKGDDRIRRQSKIRVRKNQQAVVGDITKQAIRDAGLLEEGLRLARLPFTRQEAEEVASLTPPNATLKATGFKANLATATGTDLSSYRIVHFATHALINSKRPFLSGLLLSLVDEQGQPLDGFLSLSQIYNLNLSADLVVLSACRTAIGKEVKGEGIIGLTRAFMYAGAPRIVASLWKVDDAATAEMVKLFYHAMLKQKLGPTAALRAAQLEMSKHELWSSPYYWAGFTFQGEPN